VITVGVHDEAAGAWLALVAVLDRMVSPPVCARNPEAWQTGAKADAVEACRWCPARRPCRVFGEANREPAGVWGGVDRDQRGKASR
jgi:hypothetical protein